VKINLFISTVLLISVGLSSCQSEKHQENATWTLADRVRSEYIARHPALRDENVEVFELVTLTSYLQKLAAGSSPIHAFEVKVVPPSDVIISLFWWLQIEFIS
jgi:hypothetical protein